MSGINIKTPRGTIVHTKTKSGAITAELTWAKGFDSKCNNKFSKVQKYVDSEVLRLSDPYVPMLTGMLKKSGILGTEIGSGEVNYIAPYADKQYYNNAGKGRQGITKKSSHNYKCLRGKQWFERMKADHKSEIINGAKKIAGGK